MLDLLAATLICTGIAPTIPATTIELTIRPADVKFSMIRYEISEGSLKGTAYRQSIGRMQALTKDGMNYTYQSGEGRVATTLTLMAHGTHLMDARFTHFSSGMTDSPVECVIKQQEDDDHDGGHGGHPK